MTNVLNVRVFDIGNIFHSRITSFILIIRRRQTNPELY